MVYSAFDMAGAKPTAMVLPNQSGCEADTLRLKGVGADIELPIGLGKRCAGELVSKSCNATR